MSPEELKQRELAEYESAWRQIHKQEMLGWALFYGGLVVVTIVKSGIWATTLAVIAGVAATVYGCKLLVDAKTAGKVADWRNIK